MTIHFRDTSFYTPPGASQSIQLRYGHWKPAGQTRGAAVLQGGRSECMEKHQENIEALLERGFTVWSLDWRGQGLSSRPLPDRQKGHIDSFETFLTDFHGFVQDVVVPESGRPVLMMAHSMGGHILMRYLHCYPAATEQAVFVSPMTAIQLYRVPETPIMATAESACRAGLATAFGPGQTTWNESNCNFRGNPLTSDPVRYQRMLDVYEAEPGLKVGGPTYGWLRAAFHSMRRARQTRYLRKITTPSLLVSAAADTVVDPSTHEPAANAMPNCEFLRIYDAKHEVLHENDDIRGCFFRAFDRHILKEKRY